MVARSAETEELGTEVVLSTQQAFSRDELQRYGLRHLLLQVLLKDLQRTDGSPGLNIVVPETCTQQPCAGHSPHMQ